MNNRLFCAVLILLIAIENQAQGPASTNTVDGSSYDIATNSALGLHNNGGVSEVSYDEIDGSPFFKDEFLLGDALLITGQLDDNLLLKYDLARKIFAAKLEDDTEIFINTKSIIAFRMFKDENEYLFKRVDPRYPTVFYEILYEGEDIIFYKSEDAKIVKGEELGIAKTNDRFFKDVKYYIRKGMDIKRVKLKKKTLWKYFDEKQQEKMDDFIKEHNIKLKTDLDYKRLMSILSM